MVRQIFFRFDHLNETDSCQGNQKQVIVGSKLNDSELVIAPNTFRDPGTGIAHGIRLQNMLDLVVTIKVVLDHILSHNKAIATNPPKLEGLSLLRAEGRGPTGRVR